MVFACIKAENHLEPKSCFLFLFGALSPKLSCRSCHVQTTLDALDPTPERFSETGHLIICQKCLKIFSLSLKWFRLQGFSTVKGLGFWGFRVSVGTVEGRQNSSIGTDRKRPPEAWKPLSPASPCYPTTPQRHKPSCSISHVGCLT